jgi:8-oxo-dGTP pyrophosphatase MutT (NUDIX family)
VSLRKRQKHDVRVQFAALCYRVAKARPEFLLVTSRDTRRWIVPKGWPMDGHTPTEAALIEAYEEAGVSGRAFDACIGVYSYVKRMRPGPDLACLVMVYPVLVKRLAQDYPEKGQRRRRWLSRKKAAQKASESALGRIILDFDHTLLS